MHKTLTGRVMWDETDQGICLSIPVRRGRLTAVYGPLVAVWLALATIHYWRLLAGPHPEDTNFTLQMVAIGIYAIGFIYFVCWLAWIKTGETLVTMHPPELTLQTRVLGIDLTSRTFQTHQINRIRFVPPGKARMQRSVIDPNSSCIRFDANNRIETFARGVTEGEARAMIDRMLETYQFPRNWI